MLLNHRSTARVQLEGLVIAENGEEGIVALRNSEVDLNLAAITDNGRGGLVLRENASARVIGTTICGDFTKRS